MAVIHFRRSRAELGALLRDLPKLVSGRTQDPDGFTDGVMRRMGVALLAEVQRDFITKARGGVGRDGIRWAPLKPETVARRRQGKGAIGTVEILRDTGELFRSLEPGIADKPSNADGQTFETGPGTVTVGTTKKPWHQQGNQHLPARPLWPQDGRIPDAWWSSILEAFATGLIELATLKSYHGGLRR